MVSWLIIGILAGLLLFTTLRARAEKKRAALALAATTATLTRIRQAVESASDAIGIGDMESNSLYHNRAHVELFGYSVADLNNANEPAALFADKSVAIEIHQSIRAGRSWQGETDIKAKDGRVFPAFVRADIIRDDQGRAVGIFGVFTDITQRRNQELALRASEERLRESNASLQLAVQEARQLARAAEAANEAKGAFLATMSHEIRTPLNGVIGMTNLLAGTSLTAEQRDYLATVKLSGEALLVIINDTLDYSKIEAGKVELERAPFDLVVCVEESVALVAASAAAKGLALIHRVAPGVPRLIMGDTGRLRQILVNLLGNAVKFTAVGEIVLEVAADSATATDCRLRLSVRDTGIGIAADKHDRLFQRFSQVDASNTRQYGGTGLGLAISQRLAGLMGGVITVESEEGRGSTFTFTLPAKLAAAAFSETSAGKPPDRSTEPLVTESPIAPASPTAAAPDFPAGTTPMDILVVDDNTVNQRVAQVTLRKLGYATRVAADGAAALAAAHEYAFEIIIMDVQMPVMDGLEATRRIRAELPGQDKPWIIALTAGAFEQDRINAFSAGMNDFLNKPLRVEELRAALERGYSQRSARPPSAGG